MGADAVLVHQPAAEVGRLDEKQDVGEVAEQKHAIEQGHTAAAQPQGQAVLRDEDQQQHDGETAEHIARRLAQVGMVQQHLGNLGRGLDQQRRGLAGFHSQDDAARAERQQQQPQRSKGCMPRWLAYAQ